MLSQIFSEKMLLIVLTMVGMAICSGGIGQIAERGLWLHPLSIVAYIVGALILLVVGAALFNIQLPLIDSPRAALIALVVFAIIKVVLTRLHHAIA